MKIIPAVIMIFTFFQVVAFGYESIDIINSRNWARELDYLTGYVYESHGCLHFSPADMQLLYKVVPKGTALTIKGYEAKTGSLPFPAEEVPYLADKINSPDNLKKIAGTFEYYKTDIVVYPALNLLFIMVNGNPFAKMFVQAGPPEEYLAAYDVQKGKPIAWDFMLTTPTDPGNYKVLKVTDHYLSSAYYENTVVPFGAWIKRTDHQWAYQNNNRWFALPKNVLHDLERPAAQRIYNYYDINFDETGNMVAARYAGHDFGKYVMLWTADGKNYCPEMGYAAGELVFEQIVLIKDLVFLLTVPGADDFDSCVAQNENFTFYKGLHEFVASKGKRVPAGVDPALISYYKLYNGSGLNEKDLRLMDERVLKAFYEYQETRLPRQKQKRWEALGLFHYLRTNSWIIEKQAEWYEKIKNNWGFYQNLRVKLREDFNQMGVFSLANRQNVLEGWINDRLSFKNISPPGQARYVQPLSFSTFFKPEEEISIFTQRERELMLEVLKIAVSSEAGKLNLYIVDALNNYNFGILLNEILGDLYRSHGCFHVSPRNMEFLYAILPVGSRMTVNKYSDRVSGEAVAQIPLLADLVNFNNDLDKLREQLANTREVQVAVYPFSGDWIIYLKDLPFARLQVKGGPQTRFYLVQGRDKYGKPIFEGDLAYPTTPGNYHIFRKIEDYISNTYYSTTIIPMGGVLERKKDKWFFQDRAGSRKEAPKVVSEDLIRSPDQRQYTYYNAVKDASGETFAVRWGSHPFGKLAIQTTIDNKTPWPELIHSSGDLIMEERQLINDLIRILTAPYDTLDDCITLSHNFELYKACYEFMSNPDRTDLFQSSKESAAYRLYYNLPLSSEEASQLPQDVIIANKVLRQQLLSPAEIKLLIAEGIAYNRGGKLRLNMEKILGLQFDTYQYVVAIRKYAHHYSVLKKHWGELFNLRFALLGDFNNFALKDVSLFHNFMQELMLKRNQLERLTQENALQILNGMLTEAKLKL